MRMIVLRGEVSFLYPKGIGLQADLRRKPVLRDVKERGRDVEGCIKQWTAFVKPNFERYVEPQRKVAGKPGCN